MATCDLSHPTERELSQNEHCGTHSADEPIGVVEEDVPMQGVPAAVSAEERERWQPGKVVTVDWTCTRPVFSLTFLDG